MIDKFLLSVVQCSRILAFAIKKLAPMKHADKIRGSTYPPTGSDQQTSDPNHQSTKKRIVLSPKY